MIEGVAMFEFAAKPVSGRAGAFGNDTLPIPQAEKPDF
jgi:hypothetical protein